MLVKILSPVLLACAAAQAASRPAQLPEKELAERRKALESWVFEPFALRGTTFRFHLDRKSGSFFFQDGRTGVKWFSTWARSGFASVLVAARGGEPEAAARWMAVDRVEKLRGDERGIRFRGGSSLGEIPGITFRVELLPGGSGVSLSCKAEAGGEGDEAAFTGRRIIRVRLLEDALWIPDAEADGVAVPRGLGEWIPAQGEPGVIAKLRLADAGRPGSEEPFLLPFLAMTRGGNPVLLSWRDPSTLVELRRKEVSGARFPGRGGLFVSVEREGAEAAVEIRTLGREWSPVVDGARAYFALRVRGPEPPRSLRQKTGAPADLRAFLGAAIFRPAPREKGGFAAIAGRAARLHDVLGLDRAAFILRDWSQAPSGTEESPGALHARNDCGGDAALADCSRRLKNFGFLPGLEVPDAALLGGVNTPGDRTVEDALDFLKDTAGAQIVLVRAPPGGPLGGYSPAAVEKRREVTRSLAGLPALVGIAPGLEADLSGAVYFEGLLDGCASRAASPSFWPVFTAAFGHCVRVTLSPGRAVQPDDPETLLVHMLLGEVPVYALEDDAPSGGVANPRNTPAPRDPARECFARDEGWAAGRQLSRGEIFLKNTYEVLSYLARIRSRERLLYFRRLDPAGKVLETYFGPDLRIVVNLGAAEYEDSEDRFVIPRYGFVVRHPFLLAFHALQWGGVSYERPAFFVVRSLEGKMFLRAERVRIYHGFGPARIDLGGKSFRVKREATVKIW